MEDLMIFTGIVVIAFGILQIILFFKVWVMTNEVKELKNELTSIPNKWALNKAILKGDKHKIEEILFNTMFIRLKKTYDDSYPDYDGSKEIIFAEQISIIKKEYKERYLKYDITFPDAVDKIEKSDDFENL